MVSILLPSRQRAKLLAATIESLGKGDFEFMVWVDDDDPQLQEYARLPIQMFIRPRVGYENFYKMINYLAKQSTGEWLMLWNDDMRMDGSDWTDKLEAFDFSKPVVLNFWDIANPQNNLAPIISREMYDIMGHFSLSTHCDSWVQDIANELGIHKPMPGIRATHLREVLNDETKKYTQSIYPTSSPFYDSAPMQKLRDIDINKIKAVL